MKVDPTKAPDEFNVGYRREVLRMPTRFYDWEPNKNGVVSSNEIS